MYFWGKIIGLILGLLNGGNFWIFLILVITGHLIDKFLVASKNSYLYLNKEQQIVFIQTVYQIMGHLTKSKGQVTNDDIRIVSLQMDKMQLYGKNRIIAQQSFREGKDSNFPLRQTLRRFRIICSNRLDLVRNFLEIQIQVALIDKYLHPNEKRILDIIIEELEISQTWFNQFTFTTNDSFNFENQDYKSRYKQDQKYEDKQPLLKNAYDLLGVLPSDDNAVIKRAYRRMMNKNHPDKLAAKGLSPQMMEQAKRKAQKIQAAYDFLRRKRGFR